MLVRGGAVCWGTRAQASRAKLWLTSLASLVLLGLSSWYMLAQALCALSHGEYDRCASIIECMHESSTEEAVEVSIAALPSAKESLALSKACLHVLSESEAGSGIPITQVLSVAKRHAFDAQIVRYGVILFMKEESRVPSVVEWVADMSAKYCHEFLVCAPAARYCIELSAIEPEDLVQQVGQAGYESIRISCIRMAVALRFTHYLIHDKPWQEMVLSLSPRTRGKK